MGLSDRIIVMSEGRVSAVLNRDDFGTSDQMLDCAIGGKNK
jgi:ABC-type sugar transport system ATPase subunit